jgi:hypothetical protein
MHQYERITDVFDAWQSMGEAYHAIIMTKSVMLRNIAWLHCRASAGALGA